MVSGKRASFIADWARSRSLLAVVSIVLLAVIVVTILLDLLVDAFTDWTVDNPIVVTWGTSAVVIGITAFAIDAWARQRECKRTDVPVLEAIDELGSAGLECAYDVAFAYDLFKSDVEDDRNYVELGKPSRLAEIAEELRSRIAEAREASSGLRSGGTSSSTDRKLRRPSRAIAPWIASLRSSSTLSRRGALT